METKWDVVWVVASGWLSVPEPVPVTAVVASAPLEMMGEAVALAGWRAVVPYTQLIPSCRSAYVAAARQEELCCVSGVQPMEEVG